MKLVPYTVPTQDGNQQRLAAQLAGGALLDVTAAHRLRLIEAGSAPDAAARIAAALSPHRLVDFLAAGPIAGDAIAATLEWAAPECPARLAPNGVIRLPAVPDPPMLRDFMGFEEHLKNIFPRLGREIPPVWYEMPVYYKANTASIGGDGDEIVTPPYADHLDFEFEFAAVIGRGGGDIPAARAAGHIAGYTIYNDFSARTIQAREMSVGLGPAKGKDFHRAHVLGPAFVTADEIRDPYALSMRSWVNGEAFTHGTSADMHWHFEDMIAHASRSEMLRPGEVFGSGTVGNGCAAERGEHLQPGDVITLSVEGLGTLTNTVR